VEESQETSQDTSATVAGQPEPLPPTETAEAEVAGWHRSPQLAVAWAFAPTVLMVLAGISLELRLDDVVFSLLMFVAAMGGIPAMLGWSIWMVYPANWTVAAKVILVLPIAIIMCLANLFLAFGACSIIDPPLNFQ